MPLIPPVRRFSFNEVLGREPTPDEFAGEVEGSLENTDTNAAPEMPAQGPYSDRSKALDAIVQATGKLLKSADECDRRIATKLLAFLAKYLGDGGAGDNGPATQEAFEESLGLGPRRAATGRPLRETKPSRLNRLYENFCRAVSQDQTPAASVRQWESMSELEMRTDFERALTESLNSAR